MAVEKILTLLRELDPYAYISVDTGESTVENPEPYDDWDETKTVLIQVGGRVTATIAVHPYVPLPPKEQK